MSDGTTVAYGERKTKGRKMVSIDLTYKVWWWPWERRLRGWAPTQWREMSERQYMAVVRAWLGEMDADTYHAEMFGLPKRLMKQLDSWQTYMLDRQLAWLDAPHSEVSRFFISKVEGLVAPPDALGGMTLQQYMMVDTMCMRHGDTVTEDNPTGDIGRLCKMVGSLYLKPGEGYFPDGEIKVADIEENTKLLLQRADRALLVGIWLNWKMLQNWVARAYPLLFETEEKEERQEKSHTRKLNMWLDTFDAFVGDDVAHLDSYRKMSCTDAFRLMNKRIKEARTQAVRKRHGKN